MKIITTIGSILLIVLYYVCTKIGANYGHLFRRNYNYK